MPKQGTYPPFWNCWCRLIWCTTTEETPVFVCSDENGRILGHGFCILQHSGGRLMVEHTTLYIDDICVDETARGQGVGRALYEYILDYARTKGCYNVTLNVWNCNPGAMAFYEKLGLTPYRVGMERILTPDGKFTLDLE